MGSGASSCKDELAKCSVEDLTAAMKAMSPEEMAKVKEAVSAACKPKLFDFKSGLPDCCTSNPDNYKCVAEMCGARLIEMTLGPGQEDKPHDHPAHSMFVIAGGKVAITPYNEEGKPAGEAHEVELPTGAPPIMPPGAHQVKNVGDTEVKIIFVEPTLELKACAEQPDFVSPFEAVPDCYKKLAEDDLWFTGCMTMAVGMEDKPHSHRDHLLYVLEGESLCIYPGKEKGDKKMEMQIKPCAAVPVPAGDHIVQNTGSKDIKIIFFELKK